MFVYLLERKELVGRGEKGEKEWEKGGREKETRDGESGRKGMNKEKETERSRRRGGDDNLEKLVESVCDCVHE